MRLTLFLPRNVSLKLWEQVGLFDYSVGLYQSLVEDGWKIGLVTYGGRSELDYARRLPGFQILCNHLNLPPRLYERWLPWTHGRWLLRTRIIKSYQVDGSEVAYRTARLWKKRFVARCGYLLSDFAIRGHAGDSAIARARRIESLTFRAADRAIVTTPLMSDAIAAAYQVPLERIRVIPNYVQTEVFRPEVNAGTTSPHRLVFVGRLEPQKNPLALVDACAGLDVELTIIGTGSLESAIRERATQAGVNLRLLGVRSHAELPDLLREATLFVLPTSYEGHPKAIIEAMSCALPVVAADTPGVNDVISHGRNGWLCSTDSRSIRESILHLLSQPALRLELGRNARAHVVERFSFERVAALEREMLGECLS